MFKNVSGQKVTLLAFDSATGLPKTGDGANITPYVSKDGGAVTALTDSSATEMSSTNAPGDYQFDVSQSESNADNVRFTGKSSTSGIVIVPKEYCTAPPNFTAQSIDSNGRVDVIKVAGTSQTAGDLAALINAVDDLVDTEVAAIKAKTDNLPADPADASDIAASFATINTTLQGLVLASATIGSGGNDTTHIVLNGLGHDDDQLNDYLLVFHDVSRDEYHARWIEDWVLSTSKATVATLPYTPEDATDSYWLLPIRRDVTGGSGLDAAGVRAAVGLASANLDTQLGTIDDFLDTEIAAIKAKTDQLVFTVANQVDANALTGGGGLDAAGVRAAVGLASANLDTQLGTIDDFLDTEVAAIKAKTDNLPADPADASDIAAAFATVNTKLNTIDDYLDTEIAAIKAVTDQFVFSTANRVDAQVFGLEADVITAASIAANAIGASELAADAVAEIVDGVWDAVMADHLDAGSTGVTLAAAGSAGDPWSTALPGAYGAGTAGYLVATNLNATITSRAAQADLDTLDTLVTTNLDATISSRASQSSVNTIDDYVDTEVAAILAAVDTEVAAIKAKTDQLTFTIANQVDANSLSGGTGYSGRLTPTLRRELDRFDANFTLSADGEPVDLTGWDATLTIRGIKAVIGDLSAAWYPDLVGTITADGRAEFELATPGFTGDRGYTGRVVVTDGVTTVTVEDSFNVLA